MNENYIEKKKIKKIDAYFKKIVIETFFKKGEINDKLYLRRKM